MRNDFALMAKIIAVAFAVGLDVFAISIGVGVAQIERSASYRVGAAFAIAEIAMQALGYAIGTGAGRLLGQIAAYSGCVLLAIIGILMIRSAGAQHEREFDATRGAGLLMTALSVSLDSLGVGIALPALAVPLVPLMITVSISTTGFTMAGLRFGARLGLRFEHGAERAAGVILIVLAILFAIEHMSRA